MLYSCIKFHDKTVIWKEGKKVFTLQQNSEKAMKKFFNIIPGNGSCCLLLYGEIGGEVSCGDVMRNLLEAEKQYGRIDVRINSVGGEVYPGIAIFNALRQSKADIHIYIDGIAASMASAIALCGKPVEMSRYARLMIHTVRGGCWGTKEDMQDCIKELEVLEGTLCKMYAERLGKSEDEIRSQYFDGRDHWLSAEEALAQGFIDGIYDVEENVSVSPETLLSEKMTPEEIYNTFNNRLMIEPQNESKMALLEELKKTPKFKDCASEEAALQIVAQLTQTASGAEALALENSRLKSENDAFKAEKEAAVKAEKENLLNEAEKCGKITAQTRPAFAALLESDFEAGKKALSELKATKRVMEDINVGAGVKSSWDERKAQIQAKYDEGRNR